MPDPMSSPANRALAAELRRLRDLAGLSGDEVAQRLRWSASKVSRIETNKTGIRPADLDRLLKIYDVSPGRRRQLMALASEPEPRGWWTAYGGSIDPEYEAYISLEASATRLRAWSPELVHGLLQTQAYTAEIMNLAAQPPQLLSPPKVRDRSEIRRRRQGRLTEPGTDFVLLLDEATLLRRHGGAPTMRQQLERLVELSHLPSVTIRVLGFAGLHPVPNPGAFTILEFAPLHDTDVNNIVYTERMLTNEIISDEESVHEYEIMFGRLLNEALSPDESRVLITRTIGERWS